MDPNEASASRLVAVLELSSDAIICLSTVGMITSWGPAAQQIFGYSAAEVLGEHAATLFSEDAAVDFRRARLAAAQGERLHLAQLTGQRKDNQAIVMTLYAGPIMDTGGQVSGVLLILRDITEMLAAKRTQSEALSLLGHELRTPLTSIRGALGLLAGGVLGGMSEQAAQMVGIALSNSERLAKLIAGMVDVARRSTGPLVMPMTPGIEAPPPPANNALVLLCDDDPGIRTVIGTMLEYGGYRVLLAKGGQEAVDITIDQHPDAILMDLFMPGMDGWETVGILKGRADTRNIPIIICSAVAPQLGDSLYTQVVEWVVKPLDRSVLFQALARVTTRKTDGEPVMAPLKAVEMALDQIRSFVKMRTESRVLHDGTVSHIENAGEVIGIVEGFLDYVLTHDQDPVLASLSSELGAAKARYEEARDLLNAYIRILADWRVRLTEEDQAPSPVDLAAPAAQAQAELIEAGLASPHLSRGADGELLGYPGARTERLLLEIAQRWLMEIVQAAGSADAGRAAHALGERAAEALAQATFADRMDLVNEILKFLQGLQA